MKAEGGKGMGGPAEITIPAFADPREGVLHFFGTRHGPEQPAGSERAFVVSVKQVHGSSVLVLDRPVARRESFEEGWDALVTDQPAVLLTIRTADCVPVLVHDPARRVVAAIHAGWRGAVADIVPRTLDALRERFGSESRSLRVGIGPSAGPCCYEVDEPVLSPLRERFPEWRSVVRETGSRTALLDLRALVRGQAERWGVPAEQVHRVSLCTVCSPDLFFSHRREGSRRGTMLNGIMLAG
jgi:YfiH family protein